MTSGQPILEGQVDDGEGREDGEPDHQGELVLARRAPALILARQLRQTGRWTCIDPRHAPWVALSTASALRSALTTRRRLTLKIAENAALFQNIHDELSRRSGRTPCCSRASQEVLRYPG